jgi:hypothetical protein
MLVPSDSSPKSSVLFKKFDHIAMARAHATLEGLDISQR